MRYYTADWHLGHRRILEFEPHRPWDSTEEMNAGLIATVNAVCGPDDELWVLGDAVMGRREDTLRWIAEIVPTVHLVSGNHDRTWSYAGSEARVRRAVDAHLAAGFASVQDAAEHTIGGQTVRLSHFPYTGDHTAEDRYADARLVDDGRWLLCGHMHSAWQQRGRQVNVGVDVRDYRPVSEEEVAAIIADGPADRLLDTPEVRDPADMPGWTPKP